MSEKHTILKGTFILTATGFLSRFIGFFYRMFLSHTFGEESVGLYQLIFPIYALCFSLTTAGIEVALSRCVARKVALSRHKEARQLLYVGLFLSIALSTVTAAILQTNASAFSIYILGDIRCDLLFASFRICPQLYLRILSRAKADKNSGTRTTYRTNCTSLQCICHIYDCTKKRATSHNTVCGNRSCHWRNRFFTLLYTMFYIRKSLCPYSLYLKKQFFSLKRTSKTFRASHCQPYSSEYFTEHRGNFHSHTFTTVWVHFL